MMLRYSDSCNNDKQSDGNNNTITDLTEMLCNVAPSSTFTKNETNTGTDRYIPPGYEANYKHAYRQCQDRPGGTCRFCTLHQCTYYMCLCLST
jgi:hypothetical protein